MVPNPGQVQLDPRHGHQVSVGSASSWAQSPWKRLPESGEVSEKMIPEDVELQICSALINHLHYFNTINTELQQLRELQQRSPLNFSSSPGSEPGEPESNTWYGGTALPIITAITTITFIHFNMHFYKYQCVKITEEVEKRAQKCFSADRKNCWNYRKVCFLGRLGGYVICKTGNIISLLKHVFMHASSCMSRDSPF